MLELVALFLRIDADEAIMKPVLAWIKVCAAFGVGLVAHAVTGAEIQTNNPIPLIQFEQAPLSDALELLTRQAGIACLIDSSMTHFGDGQLKPQPLISILQTNISAGQCLSLLLIQQGLGLYTNQVSGVSLITKTNTALAARWPLPMNIPVHSSGNQVNEFQPVSFTDLSWEEAMNALSAQAQIPWIPHSSIKKDAHGKLAINTYVHLGANTISAPALMSVLIRFAGFEPVYDPQTQFLIAASPGSGIVLNSKALSQWNSTSSNDKSYANIDADGKVWNPIDLEAPPLREAFRLLAKMARINFIISAAIRAEDAFAGSSQPLVTIKFNKTNPQQALFALAKAYDQVFLPIPGSSIYLLTSINSPAAAQVFAQGSLPVDPGLSLPSVTEEPIQVILFDEDPFVDVVKTLAQQTKIEFIFDPAVLVDSEGKQVQFTPVMLKANNVTIRQLLFALLASYDMSLVSNTQNKIPMVSNAPWVGKPGKSTIPVIDKSLTLAKTADDVLDLVLFENADLGGILESLARTSGVELEKNNLASDPLAPVLEQTLSIQWEHVTARQALQQLLMSHHILLAPGSTATSAHLIPGN